MKTNEENKILCSETYGAAEGKVYIVSRRGQENITSVPVRKKEQLTLTQKAILLIHELFLPKGYPNSVSNDYTAYQIWDSAQAFCSTVIGILATHEILRGVGVGDSTATASAATITWVLRDATAHIGRITFAWAEGASMDSSSKQWRLFADVLNDIALTLEVMLPFIGYTAWVLCLTTAMKAIVGVAGSATRCALTQHHALTNNLADVAAKDSSQETAMNLVASLAAIVFFPNNRHTLILWWVFLTCAHLYCNYRAVKSISLSTLNRTRFLQLIKLYLLHELVAPPADINSREPLFFKKKHNDNYLSGFQIKMGQSLNHVIKQMDISEQEMNQLINLYRSLNYLIVMDISRHTIHVQLNEAATSADMLCAYFHCIILGIVYHSVNRLPLRILNQRAEYADRPFLQLCRIVREKHPPENSLHPQLLTFLRDVCINEWKQFHRLLIDTGWNTDKQLMDVGEWRTNWQNISPTIPPSTESLMHTKSYQHRTHGSEWMIEAQNYVEEYASNQDLEDEAINSRNIKNAPSSTSIAFPNSNKKDN